MGNYFGTDGIRGLASTRFTPEQVIQIGQAVGRFLRESNPTDECWVGIGKDSRISGDLIEHSLIAGLLSCGVSVKSFGILPTPGIARLAVMEKCHMGLVISASHNPAEYNGIKLFGANGQKLDDAEEARIEYWIDQAQFGLHSDPHPGRHFVLQDAPSAYAESVIRQYPDLQLKGMKIAIDCAYGATFWTTPHVLEHFGARVCASGMVPDGTKINHECGSTFPDYIETFAREKAFSYDLAFTHDGDGDRVLARYKGKLVDGDHMITMIGMHRRGQQKLDPSTIVGTVMTNSGIENYLRDAGICLHRSAVGDRYVLEDMLKLKATIGGEQSGHLIFLDKSPTGDGLISLLETLQSAVATEFKLLDDSENIPLYSQVLLNVPVIDRDKVLQSLTFSNELEKIRKSHPDVRIVVRPSGTEPLFRILAEALDPSLSQHLARQLADIAASIS